MSKVRISAILLALFGALPGNGQNVPDSGYYKTYGSQFFLGFDLGIEFPVYAVSHAPGLRFLTPAFPNGRLLTGYRYQFKNLSTIEAGFGIGFLNLPLNHSIQTDAGNIGHPLGGLRLISELYHLPIAYLQEYRIGRRVGLYVGPGLNVSFTRTENRVENYPGGVLKIFIQAGHRYKIIPGLQLQLGISKLSRNKDKWMIGITSVFNFLPVIEGRYDFITGNTVYSGQVNHFNHLLLLTLKRVLTFYYAKHEPRKGKDLRELIRD
jgi:hypothetical protein